MKKSLVAVLSLMVILAVTLGRIQGDPLKDSAVFRMHLASEPPTLDWSLATDNVSIRVIENLMEGLAQYDDALQPIPAVAKKWDVSEDGKTYVFHLREDVHWSDGKAVTAHDFEYAWKRLLHPETASEYAYFLFDVEHAAEFNAGVINDASRVGVKALDTTTLEVKLKKKAVYFPSITTFTATYPQRKDLIETHGDHWTDPENLVTNGPFLLKGWHHEYRLTLIANETYYEGRPALDAVIFYVVSEETTALTLYETGDLDRVSLPPIAIPKYQDHPDYLRAPFLRGYYYGFNVTKSPFDDVRMRRAFSMAIDRTEIPRILKGGELPATSWIPAGMFAHNPNVGLGFDPEKARQLMREAGYRRASDVPPITLSYNTDPTNTLIAQNIQAQWKKHLGITVSLENMEWKVYLRQLKEDTPQVFRLGWGADYPDPDNFMNLFTSTSGNNNTHWGNAVFDRLISEGATEPDRSKRQKLYDAAQRILTEQDVPIIPLFFAAQNILIRPDFEGLQINAMDLLRLKNARIKSTRKVQS